MTTETITPHKAAKMLRDWRAMMRGLRATLREVRRLRVTGRVLDAEEADGALTVAHHEHHAAQAILRRLRAAHVERYSAMAPARRPAG